MTFPLFIVFQRLYLKAHVTQEMSRDNLAMSVSHSFRARPYGAEIFLQVKNKCQFQVILPFQFIPIAVIMFIHLWLFFNSV
jgi:hypothetical protein